MSKKLANFLIELASQPARADRFSQDPETVLAEADLHDHERSALRTGNSRETLVLVGGMLRAASNHIRFARKKTTPTAPKPASRPIKRRKPATKPRRKSR